MFYFRRDFRDRRSNFEARSRRKFRPIFLKSWIYDGGRYRIIRLERRAGVIRFNYQTRGRAGTLEGNFNEISNECLRGMGEYGGIKLMTCAANTRRKYELFLPLWQTRTFVSWEIREQRDGVNF